MCSQRFYIICTFLGTGFHFPIILVTEIHWYGKEQEEYVNQHDKMQNKECKTQIANQEVPITMLTLSLPCLSDPLLLESLISGKPSDVDMRWWWWWWCFLPVRTVIFRFGSEMRKKLGLYFYKFWNSLIPLLSP